MTCHALLLAAACSLAGCGSSNNGGDTSLEGWADGGGTLDGSAGDGADTHIDFTFDSAQGSETSTSHPDGAISTESGACGGSLTQATLRAANVLIVLDASGSMTKTPAGFSVNKWTAVEQAMTSALNTSSVKNAVSFGLEVFPNNLVTPIPLLCDGAECCAMPTGDSSIVVPIAAGATSVPTILTKIGAMNPAGGTPTAAALNRALAYYTTGAGKAVVGDKYVLLTTDGGPNCNSSLTCGAATCTLNLDNRCPTTVPATNCCDAKDPNATLNCLDDAATTTAIRALATAGIKTFVVGIPGSEAYQTALDAFAVAGGTAKTTSPKYFAVSAAGDVSGLTTALQSITESIIKSCVVDLASAPPEPSKVNVLIDGTAITQSGTDGWSLTLDPPTITLKGKTCTRIQNTGARSIDVQYGCPTIQ